MKKKKRSLKKLTLNKNVVSNLENNQVNGGAPATLLCPINTRLNCPDTLICPIETIACPIVTRINCPIETLVCPIETLACPINTIACPY
ncbi:class I lanthipeptide [Kordia zhangzhouensis]|uniref:class I lanthipeptide n=1 Tax=Kordia zhangzhouensis TaxID=1620405 RepID=UPI0012E0B7D1|nr:class I lanthipeptide [Kordia zhangzhouensis]